MSLLSKIDRRLGRPQGRFYGLYCRVRNRVSRNRCRDYGRGNRVEASDSFLENVRITFTGNNNRVVFERGAHMANLEIAVLGSNNALEFGPGCDLQKGHIWFSRNDGRITVGARTHIAEVSLAVAESGQSITIGSDCLFAWGIDIRCGDGHPIIDLASGGRLNRAKPIVIEDHVWLAANVQVLKGVTVGAHSVVGSHSVVTKSVPSHCVAVGIPARVVREGITWQQENDDSEDAAERPALASVVSSEAQ